VKRYILLSVIFLGICAFVEAQTDETQIEQLYKTSLTEGKSYEWLDYLSNQIGSRLSGSSGAQRAVEWTKSELDSLGLDKVWLQPVMVPRWVRGTPEYAFIETGPGETTQVPICALGGSIATPMGGVKAEVIEVQSIEEIAELGAS